MTAGPDDTHPHPGKPRPAYGVALGPELEPSRHLGARTIKCEERLAQAGRWGELGKSVWGSPWLFVPTLLLFGLVFALFIAYADYRWFVGLLLAALLLNAIVFFIARAVRHFAWLGVAVFFSVPLFGGIVTVARTDRSPKIQPVALIRKGDNVGVCGTYITETDKRIYLGRVEPDAGGHALKATGRMFWVPEDQVDMIKIGALQTVRDANTRAPRLLAELYKDRAEDPGVPLKASTVTTAKNGTTTVSETAPTPRQRPHQKPAPTTVANACTGISLASPLPPKAVPPSPNGPVRSPTDDSPPDP